ncbi:ATP-dependent DNA helicase, partial [Eubacteriales bacterium OttesenSCG-928-K08]|nr:ATP-dependent DNA helicase [Eubacteriales bacterium OttesenSCG-928-K08]
EGSQPLHTPAHIAEITTTLPPGTPARHLANGTPLFAAYGCALLERQTAKSYAYSAVNLSNGKTETLCRRAKPLDESMYPGMAMKIRASSVRGDGQHEVDRAPCERLPHMRVSEILNHIFTELLPQYGYAVRENQIGLAAHILTAIQRRAISLAESEVGTGKTHAYLTAAVLAKRGRLNDFWLRGRTLGQSYAESAYMPIVIATSSIALQRAIASDYIPELSRILLEHDIIRTPLTCVVRKGKEHFLCEKRLREFFEDADAPTKTLLHPLLKKDASCDLADAEKLTPYIKRKICVAGRCGADCTYVSRCRYTRYLAEANDPKIDFQITNHNYFLADILHRVKGMRPLLPHYQLVIIDEAHKFLQAARQMYGLELTATEIPPLVESVHSFTDGKTVSGVNVHRLAKKLGGQNKRLFEQLTENLPHSVEDETERFPAVLDAQAQRHLHNIAGIAEDLIAAIMESHTAPRFKERKSQALWQLARIGEKAGALHNRTGLICWLEGFGEDESEDPRLCAIPKDMGARLHRDIWSSGMPIILTSGTLSASGDFSRIKHSLGISHVSGAPVIETSKPSPFDHQSNTLLYLSDAVPFPDNKNKAYISAVAREVERLLYAAHGHAVVLFTSYSAMGQVYAMLKARGLPFPLFQMGRRDTAALERFKASKNGVLFASGALWEGIDIPGDALSLLIIVKLPFAAPDPIGEYEKGLYGSMDAYKEQALVPDMLVKLKQGFGRLIRTETDTGVCAILDSRARTGAPYHHRVLAALPPCRVMADVAEVERFMREKKPPEFFKEATTCTVA